jgi:hypothetical protein
MDRCPKLKTPPAKAEILHNYVEQHKIMPDEIVEGAN